MSLIATIDNANDTSFTHNFNGYVAGCYAVTAVDSLQYANESVLSNIVCFDNCPAYLLPNVFSPNGDGNNDTFKPIAPYAYVESVEFEVYNRWGQIVFESHDIEQGWDGSFGEGGDVIKEGSYIWSISFKVKDIDMIKQETCNVILIK